MVDQGSPSLEIPDPPFLRQDVYVGLTRAEREKAADLTQRLLDLVDEGDLAADVGRRPPWCGVLRAQCSR